MRRIDTTKSKLKIDGKNQNWEATVTILFEQ